MILSFKSSPVRWVIVCQTGLSLLKDPTTHDVTFKSADGASLGAHRAIIATSSPVNTVAD